MRFRDDLGAVAVETVFVTAFILIPLLAGIVDLGRALYVSITLEEVAQEAATFAAFEGGTVVQTQQRAVDATTFPVLSVADVSRTCTPVPRFRGAASRVTVNIEFTLDNFFIPPLTLRQSATVEGTSPCVP